MGLVARCEVWKSKTNRNHDGGVGVAYFNINTTVKIKKMVRQREPKIIQFCPGEVLIAICTV